MASQGGQDIEEGPTPDQSSASDLEPGIRNPLATAYRVVAGKLNVEPYRAAHEQRTVRRLEVLKKMKEGGQRTVVVPGAEDATMRPVAPSQNPPPVVQAPAAEMANFAQLQPAPVTQGGLPLPPEVPVYVPQPRPIDLGLAFRENVDYDNPMELQRLPYGVPDMMNVDDHNVRATGDRGAMNVDNTANIPGGFVMAHTSMGAHRVDQESLSAAQNVIVPEPPRVAGLKHQRSPDSDSGEHDQGNKRRKSEEGNEAAVTAPPNGTALSPTTPPVAEKPARRHEPVPGPSAAPVPSAHRQTPPAPARKVPLQPVATVAAHHRTPLVVSPAVGPVASPGIQASPAPPGMVHSPTTQALTEQIARRHEPVAGCTAVLSGGPPVAPLVPPATPSQTTPIVAEPSRDDIQHVAPLNDRGKGKQRAEDPAHDRRPHIEPTPDHELSHGNNDSKTERPRAGEPQFAGEEKKKKKKKIRFDTARPGRGFARNATLWTPPIAVPNSHPRFGAGFINTAHAGGTNATPAPEAGPSGRDSRPIADSLDKVFDALNADPDAPLTKGDLAGCFDGMMRRMNRTYETLLVHPPLPPPPRPSRKGKEVPRDLEPANFEHEPLEDRLQIKHRHYDNNLLREHLRKTALRWMGRENNTSAFHRPPSATIRLYEQSGDPCDGPSFDPNNPEEHPLRLHIKGTAGHKWNKRCFHLLAKEYVKLQDALSRNVSTVAAGYQSHFKALRTQWDKQAQDDQTIRKVISKGHRNNMRTQRQRVATRRGLGARSFADTRHWVEVIHALGVDGQSNGVTAPLPGVPSLAYCVTENPEWRSEAARDMLRATDYLQLRTRFAQDGRTLKGSFPHTRVSGNVIQTTKPVVGLPRNCYDDKWIAKQDSLVIDRLKIRAPCNLTITPKINEEIETIKARLADPALRREDDSGSSSEE